MTGAGEFSRGRYARISDGVVFVIGNERGLFESIRIDRDEECEHCGSELTAWTPEQGEQVAEYSNEDCVTGTVIEVGDGTSLVMWAGFTEPQVWRNAKLEPALIGN
jgi:hypothetical protein